VNNFRPILIALSMTIVASSASAAHPFYHAMLERGVASATRGDDATALRELQTAAFGLLEDLPKYELAQVHIALVSKRLGNEGLMRTATAKVAQVEQLEPAYSRIPLAPNVRVAFNALAPTILAPEQLALLLPTVGTRETQVITNSTLVAPPAAAPQVVETVTEASTLSRAEVLASRLRGAEALVDKRDFAAATRAYKMLLLEPKLERAQLLQIGRGLSRARAWQESAAAYQRTMPLRAGEEIHMFHHAVSRYELGELNLARALMQQAGSKLPKTAEIADYRAKISVN
jgi:hypothetical protein